MMPALFTSTSSRPMSVTPMAAAGAATAAAAAPLAGRTRRARVRIFVFGALLHRLFGRPHVVAQALDVGTVLARDVFPGRAGAALGDQRLDRHVCLARE